MGSRSPKNLAVLKVDIGVQEEVAVIRDGLIGAVHPLATVAEKIGNSDGDIGLVISCSFTPDVLSGS